MASSLQQPVQRAVLRKQPVPTAADTAARAPQGSTADQEGLEPVQSAEPPLGAPYCLLDAVSWSLCPGAVAKLLSSSNGDFSVVGVLGAQGLGKSWLLNRLLGFTGALSAAGPHPTPAFPVSRPADAGAGGSVGMPALQHCTCGVELRVSSDRLIGLDTQPLFSASVLEEMAGKWEQPPSALAAPAVAAAGDAKAAAVPFEGVQALAQLQLAALLLTACHRVLVLCDGLDDYRTWELLLTAEMLARGLPDPSLPPKDAAVAATAAPASGAPAAQAAAGSLAAATQQQQQSQQQQGQPKARQAAQAEHLAEVVLVHVLPPASGGSTTSGAPSMQELELLEARLAAFFTSSRLCCPRPLRMRTALAGSSSGHGNSDDSSRGGSSGVEGVSYWVLSHPSDGACAASGADALVAALLTRPCQPFARRCSELGWLRGTAGNVWRAVRKSPDIAAFYSRFARTQLKGAGGWGLAR